MHNIITFPTSPTSCSDATGGGLMKSESKPLELQHLERLRDLMQVVYGAVMTIHSEIADTNIAGDNGNRDTAEDEHHATSHPR